MAGRCTAKARLTGGSLRVLVRELEDTILSVSDAMVMVYFLCGWMSFALHLLLFHHHTPKRTKRVASASRRHNTKKQQLNRRPPPSTSTTYSYLNERHPGPPLPHRCHHRPPLLPSDILRHGFRDDTSCQQQQKAQAQQLPEHNPTGPSRCHPWDCRSLQDLYRHTQGQCVCWRLSRFYR